MFNKDKRTYELAAAYGTDSKPIVLSEQEPFITFLRETEEPIGQGAEFKRVHFPEVVTGRLKELKAQLCLPLHVHDDLIGVLCLGKKKSDEEFTKDDLDILLPLTRTLAIAVSNAQLFDELAKTQAEAMQKEKLAVIQECFIDKGAIQCGFCTPAMILSGKALLERNSRPSREEIREAISGVLCRCTGYKKIVDAIEETSLRQGGG